MTRVEKERAEDLVREVREPDTKDWTWVLERACPECGFDVSTFPREEIGSMIRGLPFGSTSTTTPGILPPVSTSVTAPERRPSAGASES